jgi:pimeloyl-ACP methyl ester carboxylesterase
VKLILLPGMDGTGRLFERLLAVLPPEISPRVISYESAPAHDYDSLCTFVSTLLPSLLQSREPFVLLGESFSGPIAVRVGALAPDCVGVVLVASFVRCPMRVPRWATRIAGPLRYLSAPSAAARTFLLNGHDDVTLANELSATLKRVPPAIIAARLAAVISVDARDALTQLGIPVLDIRAERDRLVGARAANDIALYGDEVTTLEIDAPHMVLQASPVECARAIVKFIASLKPTK